MDGLHEALPAVENVFGIDMSGGLRRSYEELLWAGKVKEKYTYYFGKSGGDLRPLTNWAWLLPKYSGPPARLVLQLHEIRRDAHGRHLRYRRYPAERSLRHESGARSSATSATTVFKSGWETDDFVFVMRTGPFFNHQFMDQGSFWLSDRGSLFVERPHGSTEPYVGAVLYEPSYIQPVSHNTILVDGNIESQRTGDIRGFAEGFEQYAFIDQFLDGSRAAFQPGRHRAAVQGKGRRAPA